jgi:hypothetical protein
MKSLNSMKVMADAKGVPDADTKRAADDAMYRSICFNSPLFCSPDQRSVAPAELVKFDSVPPGAGPLIMQGCLRRPDGIGPFPVVVLWHGCGGLAESLDQNWAASLMGLSAWLSENQCTHIAMEATGVYWKPVWHILSDDEFELVLANAAHVKNVPGRKTNVKDADWVSDLLAHGLIGASFVPDRPRRCAH